MEAVEVANAAKAREREIAAAVAASSPALPLPADGTIVTDADTTYTANATGVSSNKSGGLPKKKVGKAKLSAKEKKERIVRRASCFYRVVLLIFGLVCSSRLKESYRVYRSSSEVAIPYATHFIVMTTLLTLLSIDRV